jgi:hypothetical protein
MKSKRTLGTLAAMCLSLLAVSAAQGAGAGARYVFRGHLLATPPANATSIAISVEGGNRIALQKMLGASVDQTFTVGRGTEFLKWSHGVPTVVQSNDLTAGDWLVIRLHAPWNATLSQVEARPAGIVSDRVTEPTPPTRPLYLFRGKLAAPAGTSTLTLDVRGGNRPALRLLVGQPSQQTFTYGPETIFLLWQGKVPSVISPSQLTVGEPVTVRIRAPRGATLAQVESTPARHVGEHEPANTPITS